jgi:hypothetical protein
MYSGIQEKAPAERLVSLSTFQILVYGVIKIVTPNMRMRRAGLSVLPLIHTLL